MFIILVITALMLCILVFKLLWLVRMGALAHWSYLIGCACYPYDASRSILLTASLFGFMCFGSIMPGLFFPRVKLVATAMSIPAQIHMLYLLHTQVSGRIDNDTVTKSVQAYSVLTLISTVWTIFTLLWMYQTSRIYVTVRRRDSNPLNRRLQLQLEERAESSNIYNSIYT